MLSEVSGEEADLPECAAGVPGRVGRKAHYSSFLGVPFVLGRLLRRSAPRKIQFHYITEGVSINEYTT
jgi:hypothetical protein